MWLPSIGETTALAIVLSSTFVPAVASASDPITFMAVGSSISQGWEGDFTWRYRLWEWFRDQQVNATFVGPYNGTYPQTEGSVAVCKTIRPRAAVQKPSVSLNSLTSASYAGTVDENWPSAHFAIRNQLASQLKLENTAKQFRPDYILLEVGLNDLLYKKHPSDIVADLKRLVEEGRAARADTRFAIATIPSMEQLAGMPYLLPGWTDELNEDLEYEIEQWSTELSPISLVRLRETYDCTPNACPVAWDAIHPAELGEYQIASAFSKTLHTDFGMGSGPLQVPAASDVPQSPIMAPSNLQAETVPWGIKLTWDKVVGAHRYEVNRRRMNTSDWQTSWSGNGHEYGANRYDTLDVASGEEWEFRVRTNKGEVFGVLRVSDWTPVVSAIAQPKTDICGRPLEHTSILAVHWASGPKVVSILAFGFLIISATVYEATRRVFGPSFTH